MTELEACEIINRVKAMNNHERSLVVQNLPTEILFNEIKRRITNQEEKLKKFKELSLEVN